MGKPLLFPTKSASELLQEFKDTGCQQPFEEIVRRYAGMVFGVCMRITNDAHDAEDATQAVFLSLALQAKQSRDIKYLGPWLQQVAKRLALDAKRSKTRRKKREDNFCEMSRDRNLPLDPAMAPDQDETKRLLNEELNRLPAKYRLPLVLHYFGGLSRDEMARELGCKPSTLGVRVHRGRAMLGNRLAARGIQMSGAALVVLLAATIRGAVSDQMMWATSHAATQLFANGTGAYPMSAMLPVHIMDMARTATRSVMAGKLKTAAAAAALTAASALAATGGNVSNYLPDLRLNFKLDLMRWVRPMFQSLIPRLQADGKQVEKSVEVDGAAREAIAKDWTPDLTRDVRTSVSAEGLSHPEIAAIAPVEQIAKPQATAKPETKLEVSVAATDSEKPLMLPPLDAVESGSPTSTSSTSTSSESSETYVLGANPGTSEHASLSEGEIHSADAIIGDSGNGSFTQSGGVHAIVGGLTLGNNQGASGLYVLTGGLLTAKSQTIGNFGEGTFHQRGGVNRVRDGGKGIISLGKEKSGKGTYVLEGGVIDADGMVIGDKGSGDLTIAGGEVTTATLTLGAQPASFGNLTLTSGSLNLTSDTGAPRVTVADAGTGTLHLGNALSTGTITSTGTIPSTTSTVASYQPVAKFAVRAQSSAEGELRGWGPIDIGGTLVMNGRVVADGYGNDRSLDMTGFKNVRNTIDNANVDGTNGWFAQNGGKIMLPAIHVTKGTGIYTWGEDSNDPKLDLVNSVRMRVIDADADAMIKISLMSLDRDDIPELPHGHHFLGVWKLKPAGIHFDGLDLMIRYDDGAAVAQGLNESILKLWEYDRGQWHRIWDASFGLDTIDNLIAGHAQGTLSYFAVSAPEPSCIGFISIALGTGLMRRARRKS